MVLGVLLVLVAACGGANAPNGQPTFDVPGQTGGVGPALPAETVRFYRQGINDPSADGLVAFSFLVPDGWAYQGAVEWMPAFVRTAFHQTTISDPATGTTIDWLPIQDFIWFEAPAGLEAPIGGNYQGKILLPPITDPATFVEQFWTPNVLPQLAGATLLDIQEVPAIAQDFVDRFGGQATAGAWRIRYEYVRDGVTWEEDVRFALLFSGPPELVSWYVNYAYTTRAPKGQLDAQAGLLSTIAASRESTVEWEAIYRQVQQLFNQGVQSQMNDTVAFGQTLARHRAEIQALQAQVTAERQASQDRIADLRGQTLAGVQTYTDPDTGGFVQLPAGFDTYWVNDRGEFLTSGDPGFDPNTLNDGFWRRLQPRT